MTLGPPAPHELEAYMSRMAGDIGAAVCGAARFRLAPGQAAVFGDDTRR